MKTNLQLFQFGAGVLSCLALFPRPALPQAILTSDSVIARAGDLFVTEDEFIRRFELLPAFARHRKSQIEEAKRELVYSMIAEKLLAQEASASRIDRDTGVIAAVEEVRKLLARDELYRREIINKVSVSDQDLIQGTLRARRQLSISFLFCRMENDANFLRTRLAGGGDFDRLTIDPAMEVLRDTATVRWGEAEASIEDAAYRLQRGEISPVVRAGGGYYILRLDGEEPDPSIISLQPFALTEKVGKTIRLRKEKARLEQYVHEVLKDRRSYAVARSLRNLAEAIASSCPSSPRDTIASLTPEVAARAREILGERAGDSLVVVDSTVWSVGEVLDRLALKSLSFRGGDRLSVIRVLDSQLQVWAEQELIGREAIRRSMDSVPAVKKRIELWEQYYLAEQMKDRVRRKVTLTDAEVWEFMRAQDTSLSVPQVQLRELRTASIADMSDALDDLRKGMTLEDVVRRRSVDSDLRAKGGVTEFFSITERTPEGPLAWEMKAGDRFGPVPARGGYLFFELLAKRSTPHDADTSFASRFAAARDRLLRLKGNRRVSLYLAQAGNERGFEVFEDRLRAIDVSPIPMMTFRILGFGGRMFEVPFVEKQIEWLGIEPPAVKMIP